MPYASPKELPQAVKDRVKGKKKRRQWMHVFNESHAKHGDESRAFAEAWAVANRAMSKVEKRDKSEVDYGPGKTDTKCLNCKHFTNLRPPDFESGDCELVKGLVEASMWCKLFTKKAGTIRKATNMTDDKAKFTFFLPIEKVDKKARTVSGYASTPSRDMDGEIVSLDAVKKALPNYMEWRNIREMHRLSAVGTAQEASVDNKGLYLTAKITDDAAWAKCVDEVYKGFSIGGRKLDKVGDVITEIEMTEISIVDRPANPDCRLSIAKRAKDVTEGIGGHLLKLATSDATAKAVGKIAKAAAKLAKASSPPAAHDGLSLPAKPAPVEKPKEKTPEELAADETARKAAAVADDEAKIKKKKKAKLAIKTVQTLDLAKAVVAPAGDAPAFLSLGKTKPAKDLRKGMGVATTLSCAFDSIRGAQRSLLIEATREGGDMKDKGLATKLGSIAKDLAEVIGQKAEHEGGEALDLSDADDCFLSSILGEDFTMTKQVEALLANFGEENDSLAKALATMLKRAGTPSRVARIGMASDNIKKASQARKAAMGAIEEAHSMHKAAYLAKAAASKKDKKDDDADDFDHADAMEKLQKAYGELTKMKTFMKMAKVQLEKAVSRSGQNGQETTDGEGAFYEVPAGVRNLTPADLEHAGPGSKGGGGDAPENMSDKRFPGKAALITTDHAEALVKAAKAEGELEVLRRVQLGGGGNGRGRPFNFDLNKVITGGTAEETKDKNVLLFKGVDPAALASTDEDTHNAATARVLGNLLTSTGLGKSIFSEDFRGAAGGRG